MKKRQFMKKIICVLIIVTIFVMMIPVGSADTNEGVRVRVPDEIEPQDVWSWGSEFARGFFTEPIRTVSPDISWEWCFDEQRQLQYVTGFFAITQDDYLYAWGENHYGQLGDGTTTDRTTPVRIMGSVWHIGRDGNHAIARQRDRTVWVWGRNPDSPTVDAAIRDYRVPTQIFDSVFLQMSSAVLRYDGSLWTWGQNNNAQVGDGTTEYRIEPFNVMNNVIAVGGCINCDIAALTEDREVWAWGVRNFDWQNRRIAYRPEKILDDVVYIGGA